jgi:diaminopropionate ammonia-lyase
VFVNSHLDSGSVAAVSDEAVAFHRSLPGYAPTPLRALDGIAEELGLAAVWQKDESGRLGLPAFKVLGASWAAERALRSRPEVRTLVTASAGNHGRAVAWVARMRGLRCRVLLPARSSEARRAAIAAEGAEVVVVDGTYEEAVALAAREGEAADVLELADTGSSGPASWVIDGYATLFAELDAQAEIDTVIVPVGVGALGAAAARFAAASHGVRAIAVEPVSAACLTESLRAGGMVTIPTPGTTMAGLDCAEVSAAAWPDLRAGIAATVTVTDDQAHDAMRELAALGLAIGDSGAAPLAALRAIAGELDAASRVALIATEGPTDPDGYARTVGAVPRSSEGVPGDPG